VLIRSPFPNLLQFLFPGLHVYTYLPLEHDADAFGGLMHLVLHVPQLFTSLLVSTSHSLPQLLSQFWYGALQENPHLPPEHEGTPFPHPGHFTLHLPQLFTFVNGQIHPLQSCPAKQFHAWAAPAKNNITMT
jgi:hypothetical protein